MNEKPAPAPAPAAAPPLTSDGMPYEKIYGKPQKPKKPTAAEERAATLKIIGQVLDLPVTAELVVRAMNLLSDEKLRMIVELFGKGEANYCRQLLEEVQAEAAGNLPVPVVDLPVVEVPEPPAAPAP